MSPKEAVLIEEEPAVATEGGGIFAVVAIVRGCGGGRETGRGGPFFLVETGAEADKVEATCTPELLGPLVGFVPLGPAARTSVEVSGEFVGAYWNN